MSAFTFRVDAPALASAVTWVAKHLPTKPYVPVIAGMVIGYQDGQATLAGFDFDTSATATLEIDGSGNGRVLVSGRLLSELVKTFPDKPVTVTADSDNVKVVCGSIRLTLPLMNIDDYPALPATPPVVGEISGAAFADLIGRVGLAADTTGASSVVALHGIHLTFDPRQVEVLASDRYRAAGGRADWTGKTDDTVTALVPSPVLIDAAKAVDAASQVTIGCASNLISIASAGRTTTSRLLDGKFPAEAARSYFTGRGTQPVTVWSVQLRDAVRRAGLVRGDKTAPVLLDITGDAITVSARGNDIAAETGETVDCVYHGPPFAVHANPVYLADALTGLASKRAELTITDPHKPIVLTAPDAPPATYQHVLVPIRNHS